MNYLAHSFLSFNHTEIMVGNFIADSVPGNHFEHFTQPIIQGIKLHRKIDAYTDQHPIYLSSKHRFSAQFDKYSGVLMDIFYDHFLAKNFHLYSPQSLETFSQSVYSDLAHYLPIMPEHAKRFYEYMTKHHILFHYSNTNHIETVLTHLSHRIRNRVELQQAMPLFKEQYEEIESEFFAFFDDLVEYCKKQPEFL